MEGEAGSPWDPIADYQVMTRYVDAYMELWRSPKPVIAQVQRYCVAGGTDFALCSDLIVCDSRTAASATRRRACGARRRRRCGSTGSASSAPSGCC